MLIQGTTGPLSHTVTGSNSTTTFYYKDKVESKWITVDNAAVGHCGKPFSASMSVCFSKQVSYDLGGSLTIGPASISGSVSVGQGQEFCTTINVPEQAEEKCCYFVAYPATVQYDAYRIDITYKKYTCVIPIICVFSEEGSMPDVHLKTLYKHTSYFLCKCCGCTESNP